MYKSESYKINNPKVVHENIDGEAVIVNLEKGDYYSLVQTAADVWDMIEKGLSRDHIIEGMLQQYEGDRKEIESAVNNFLEELQREELIIVSQNNGSINTPITEVQIQTNANQEKLKFEPPALEKYTDMEELIALDPIHEVDEMGWPNAKQVQV